MKHLSVRTSSLPREVVLAFIPCNFRMGDDFVDHVNEVTCSNCLDQLRERLGVAGISLVDEPLLRDRAEQRAGQWLQHHTSLPAEQREQIIASLADLLQGKVE